MRVALIGAGYVGLVSGTCFADFGHPMVCFDKDTAKTTAIERGEMPIYEPDLDRLFATNTREGRFASHTLARRERQCRGA
jgi:UDPglucose 6-dehydrogenase